MGRRVSLATTAAAAVVALLLGVAAAQSDKFVSNVDQADTFATTEQCFGTGCSYTYIAQGFSVSEDMWLDAVTVFRRNSATTAIPSMLFFQGEPPSGAVPADAITLFHGDSLATTDTTFGEVEVRYSAAGKRGLALEAGALYYIALEAVGGSGAGYYIGQRVSTTNEDTGSAGAIADTMRRMATVGGSWESVASPLRMRVSARPATPIPGASISNLFQNTETTVTAAGAITQLSMAFVPAADMDVEAVTLRVDDMDDSGSPQVGIYTDSGGEPGSLVGTAMLPVGGMTAGKNLVQFKVETTPVQVTGGTTYHVVFTSSGGSYDLFTAASGPADTTHGTFGTEVLAFDGTWTAGPAGTRLLAQVAAPSCEGFASGTYHYPGELTDVAFVGNNVEFTIVFPPIDGRVLPAAGSSIAIHDETDTACPSLASLPLDSVTDEGVAKATLTYAQVSGCATAENLEGGSLNGLFGATSGTVTKGLRYHLVVHFQFIENFCIYRLATPFVSQRHVSEIGQIVIQVPTQTAVETQVTIYDDANLDLSVIQVSSTVTEIDVDGDDTADEVAFALTIGLSTMVQAPFKVIDFAFGATSPAPPGITSGTASLYSGPECTGTAPCVETHSATYTTALGASPCELSGPYKFAFKVGCWSTAQADCPFEPSDLDRVFEFTANILAPTVCPVSGATQVISGVVDTFRGDVSTDFCNEPGLSVDDFVDGDDACFKVTVTSEFPIQTVEIVEIYVAVDTETYEVDHTGSTWEASSGAVDTQVISLNAFPNPAFTVPFDSSVAVTFTLQVDVAYGTGSRRRALLQSEAPQRSVLTALVTISGEGVGQAIGLGTIVADEPFRVRDYPWLIVLMVVASMLLVASCGLVYELRRRSRHEKRVIAEINALHSKVLEGRFDSMSAFPTIGDAPSMMLAKSTAPGSGSASGGSTSSSSAASSHSSSDASSAAVLAPAGQGKTAEKKEKKKKRVRRGRRSKHKKGDAGDSSPGKQTQQSSEPPAQE